MIFFAVLQLTSVVWDEGQANCSLEALGSVSVLRNEKS
jgi:hypothetical protein